MKYNGIELKEFTSDKPIAFSTPRPMLVWDDDDRTCRYADVLAYLPESTSPVIEDCSFWQHCAEIPEEPKPRRATNLELAKWLAQGNGLCKNRNGTGGPIWTNIGVSELTLNDECCQSWVIRKWEDTEWHEPTVDYLGLEG